MCENAITLHNLISTVNDLQYQKKNPFLGGGICQGVTVNRFDRTHRLLNMTGE